MKAEACFSTGRYGSPRGTLYAVYAFLEQLGVRWWAPDETFLPTCFSSDKFIWACEELWWVLILHNLFSDTQN
jgi:hypothetical protein